MVEVNHTHTHFPVEHPRTEHLLSTSRGERLPSPRRIQPDELSRKLARKLQSVDAKLCEMIASTEPTRPIAPLAELALHSLKSSLGRYKGYNPEERKQLMQQVVACIRSGEFQVRPSQAPKSPEEPTTPRELTARQLEQQSADRERSQTPKPEDMPKNRGGRPKAVPRSVDEHDLRLTKEKVLELMRTHPGFKDACATMGTPWSDDPDLKELMRALRGQLNQPRQIKRYITLAVKALVVGYDEAADAPEGSVDAAPPRDRPSAKRVEAVRSVLTAQPAVKPPTAEEKAAARREGMGEDMWAKFEAASANMKQPFVSKPVHTDE